MPTVKRQVPPRPETPKLSVNGDILDSGVQVAALNTSKINVAVYGRNRVGKTTLACQGGVATALLSIEPSPTGGAGSVKHMSNVVSYQVAANYIKDKDGKLEKIKGSEKMLAIVDSLRKRFDAGQRPFEKVVIDGVTSWNDVILSEVIGLDYSKMPAILGLGEVTGDQYKERSEKLIRYLRPFFDLPCDVWILAQEKDHNPPKTDTITKKGATYSRPTQSALMREAHPMAQEGSFFSLGVSDTQAKYIQDACDYVMQLYEDNELVEEKLPDIPMNGQMIPGEVRLVATGRRVKRLRCVYHPNYAAGCRGDYKVIPEYIEAHTPEERYDAIMDMASGKKTKFGHYKE